MPHEKDMELLRQMLMAAKEIAAFSSGRKYTDLANDKMYERAVEMSLQIIGEAAGDVSGTLRNKYPQIPWQRIIGTRNRVVHAYATIELNTLWLIIVNDLPGLIANLEKILKNEL
jgi:uncharacterized protein with HEPN domain